MQRVGDLCALGGSGGVDEDMADGDLGNGTRTQPKTDPDTQGGQRCTGLSSAGSSRRASEVCSVGAQWRPGAEWSHSEQSNLNITGSLSDLSKEELIDRLQKAMGTIHVLESELEAAHRYLEGKYAALKILQGQAILDRATSHTKSLVQKGEERAKSLEKEVNSLQWELCLSQLRLRTSEQAFEKNFYRMLSERNSLSETLKQKELEKRQLRAENLALSAQYMELLSRVRPHRICPTTKTQQRRERLTAAKTFPTPASHRAEAEDTPQNSHASVHNQPSECQPPD